jgi:uncharacterized protein
MADESSLRKNRLAKETSPYLLQHQHNPVDWHPWGEEAFEKARRENKPLLVSIGYSACHWCHVMERESFENPEIARLVNETVVPVKVDREERPDVDAIYMNACMAMNGQGGWPLNAFVTPELKPFFVGTYFPPDDRLGRAGFPTVLGRVREAWLTDRAGIVSQAGALHAELERHAQGGRSGAIDDSVYDRAVNEAANQFDLANGGFGNAPKFPPDLRLGMLLAIAHDQQSEVALRLAGRTLEAMAHGGMYDQLGGGFARYSVDARWLIPHFEKMLYNQALLVPVYLDAHLLGGNALFLRVACETLDWVLRDLRSADGVFFSALDADSEGEEGRYYVWTPTQVAQVLGGDDAALFCEYYGVTESGNFEHGTSALHVPVALEEFAARHGMERAAWEARLCSMKGKMLEARAGRVPPATDDKALTGWNGLMIGALCRGWQVSGEQRYLDAARTAADFMLERQLRPDGELLRVFAKGESRIRAMLDDYAFLTAGLIDLYESCFDRRYLDSALRLGEATLGAFADRDAGGLHFTDGRDPSLISRTRENHDGAVPSASGVATMNLLRLAAFFDRADLREFAARCMAHAGPQANMVPSAFPSFVMAHRFATGITPQIAVAGSLSSDEAHSLLRTVWRTYLPCRTLVWADATTADLPICQGKSAGGNATAFVCANYLCRKPVGTPGDLQAELDQLFG